MVALLGRMAGKKRDEAMTAEPRVGSSDLLALGTWQKTYSHHARTVAFARRVDASRRIIDKALASASSWAVMWSGGKDSTVMAHMLTEHGFQVLSEKDDLDYPGEEDYVQSIASAHGWRLTIVRPPVSPEAWLRANRDAVVVGDDMHSRAAGLSKACFYGLIEAASAPYQGIFLGLRASESRDRATNRAVNGTLYRRRSGQWTCCPLADWTGLDVLTYAHAHELELLHVYRCIGLMHSRAPWNLRKSWWIPGGSSTRHGQVAWLRHYWPSLYHKLTTMLRGAEEFR